MAKKLPDPEEGQSAPATVDYYGANYAHFASSVHQEVRREAFGEEMGQNSWHTADEQQKFVTWLDIGPSSRVLDVACGSGGPAVRLSRITGCDILGIDNHQQAIDIANNLARGEGVEQRARFNRMEATPPLPIPDSSFDVVVCIDAVNHFPDRPRVLAEWARLLRPGGRLLFTDPTVVTGPLSNVEIAIRSSIGFFLFVPAGEDERLIGGAGLELVARENVTQNMAAIARRWHAARETREKALREIEGDTTFEGQQEFFRVAEIIARERRLSRFVYVAVKRG